MSLGRLAGARKKTVGTKQTKKAIERGQAKMVFVAQNAERQVIDPVVRSCKEKGISIVFVDTMQTLGKACGIDVGCAVACIGDD